jgi:hypothetical protein
MISDISAPNALDCRKKSKNKVMRKSYLKKMLHKGNSDENRLLSKMLPRPQGIA